MIQLKKMKQSICRVMVERVINIPISITMEQVNEVEVYIPHIVEVTENLNEYLSSDDLILYFSKLGGFYQDQGLYLQAQLWLEKGKQISEKRLGAEHPNVSLYLNSLANLYIVQGRYEDAEPLCLQSFKMCKKFSVVKTFAFV